MPTLCHLKFTAPLPPQPGTNLPINAFWQSGVYPQLVAPPFAHPPLNGPTVMQPGSTVTFTFTVALNGVGPLLPSGVVMIVAGNWPVECGKGIRLELGEAFATSRKSAGLGTLPRMYPNLATATVTFSDQGVLHLMRDGLTVHYDLRSMSLPTQAQEYSVIIEPGASTTVTVQKDGVLLATVA